MADNVTGKYLDYEGLKEVFRLIKEFKGGDENNTSCDCPEKLEEIEKRLNELELQIGISEYALEGEFYANTPEENLYCYINGVKIPLTKKFKLSWEEISELLPEGLKDNFKYGIKESFGMGDIEGGEDFPVVIFPNGLKKINNFPDISKTDSLAFAFLYNTTVTDIDTSDFDTSNINDMAYTFAACTSLKNIDVSAWDVSKVRSMQAMFGLCTSLYNVDMRRWDLRNLTQMDMMFMQSGIKTLDCMAPIDDQDQFELPRVTTTEAMFSYCRDLTDVSAITTWNIPKLEVFNEMFLGCSSLVHAHWFNCEFENSFNLFAGTSDKSVEPMYSDCPNLRTLSVHNLFELKNELTQYGIGSLPMYLINVILGNSINHITDIYVDINDTSGTENDHGVVNLEDQTIFNIGDPNSGGYKPFPKLEYIPTFKVNNDALCGGTFKDFVSLKEATIQAKRFIGANSMFENCHSLRKVRLCEDVNYVGSINTSLSGTCTNMFLNCYNLKDAILHNVTTEGVTYMVNLFKNCTSLQKLDLSNFTIPETLIDASGMFENCLSLQELIIPEMDPVVSSKYLDFGVGGAERMFDGCNNLYKITCKKTFRDWLWNLLEKDNKLKDVKTLKVNYGTGKPIQKPTYEPNEGSWEDRKLVITAKKEGQTPLTFDMTIWGLRTSKDAGSWLGSRCQGVVPSEFYIIRKDGKLSTDKIYGTRYEFSNYNYNTGNDITSGGEPSPTSGGALWFNAYNKEGKKLNEISFQENGEVTSCYEIPADIVDEVDYFELVTGSRTIVKVVDADDPTPVLVCDTSSLELLWGMAGTDANTYYQLSVGQTPHFAVVANGEIDPTWEFEVASEYITLDEDPIGKVDTIFDLPKQMWPDGDCKWTLV